MFPAHTSAHAQAAVSETAEQLAAASKRLADLTERAELLEAERRKVAQEVACLRAIAQQKEELLRLVRGAVSFPGSAPDKGPAGGAAGQFQEVACRVQDSVIDSGRCDHFRRKRGWSCSAPPLPNPLRCALLWLATRIVSGLTHLILLGTDTHPRKFVTFPITCAAQLASGTAERVVGRKRKLAQARSLSKYWDLPLALPPFGRIGAIQHRDLLRDTKRFPVVCRSERCYCSRR